MSNPDHFEQLRRTAFARGMDDYARGNAVNPYRNHATDEASAWSEGYSNAKEIAEDELRESREDGPRDMPEGY